MMQPAAGYWRIDVMTNSMDDTNLLQNNKLGITDYLELARRRASVKAAGY